MAIWRISNNARKLRATPTNAERILWRALRGRRFAGRKFRRQHPIDRYVVDFICIAKRLIIEIDGATHSTTGEMARDANRTRVLETLGFQVIRVSNIDVYKNLEGVLEMIAEHLKLS
jgi:very-short-patch-repair endonuclease